MADDDDDDENDDDEDDGVQGPLATKGTNAADKQARTHEAHMYTTAHSQSLR